MVVDMNFKNYKKEVLKDPRSNKLSFEADRRSHYVYRVSELFGEKCHYYGSKTEKEISCSLGLSYFTRSRDFDFIKDFKENRKNYRVKILRYFNNRSDAIIFESYLHQKFNAKDHFSFLNRANQTPFGFDVTGIRKTEKSKKKLSESQLKTHREIRKDPKRYQKIKDTMKTAQERVNQDPIKKKRKSQKISQSLKKFNGKFWRNPEKSEKRRKNLSEKQQELKQDPIRSKKRSEKISKINLERYQNMSDEKRKELTLSISNGWKRLLQDPIKAKKISEERSKSIKQFDLEGNFIVEHPSRLIAAKAVGLKSSGRLSIVVNQPTKTAGGYKWED